MIKLLFVSGFGRSGSSILDMYLNNNYNFISLGEVRYFFERGLVDQELCSCSKDVFQCEFWGKVIEEFGKEELNINKKNYAQLTKKFESGKKFLIYFLFHKFYKKYSKEFNAYLKLQFKLFESIEKVSEDNEILIDSSKFSSRALWLILYGNAFLDIRVLHIIRNPVANAYSWTKKKERPEASSKDRIVYMRQFGFLEACFRWINNNFSSYMLRFLNSEKYFLLKYEHFCKNPKIVIQNTLNELFRDTLSENKTNFYHSISGNPMRMSQKEITIMCDDSWKEKISGYKRIIMLICNKLYER